MNRPIRRKKLGGGENLIQVGKRGRWEKGGSDTGVDGGSLTGIQEGKKRPKIENKAAESGWERKRLRILREKSGIGGGTP